MEHAKGGVLSPFCLPGEEFPWVSTRLKRPREGRRLGPEPEGPALWEIALPLSRAISVGGGVAGFPRNAATLSRIAGHLRAREWARARGVGRGGLRPPDLERWAQQWQRRGQRKARGTVK